LKRKQRSGSTADHIVRHQRTLMPFNSNSPTGSTFTAFSTFIKTLGLMRDLSRLGFVAEPRGHGFGTPGNRYVGRFDYAIKVLKKSVSRVVNRETLSK
jgi:hypothetical protein